MNSQYKISNKKNLHDGFFKLHEITFTHQKHDGSWSPALKREIFSGAHVVTVLPYDPIKKRILLLKQFRAGIIDRKDDPMLTEIVAGIIDKDETPIQAARRECMEETGCLTNKLTEIYSYYPAPGSSESYYYFFLAEINAVEGKQIFGIESENEDILVNSYSVQEVKKLLKEKKIINAATLIALQWFFLEYYKD